MRRRTLLSAAAVPPLVPLLPALSGCSTDEEVVPPVPPDIAGPQRLTYGADPTQFVELSRPEGRPVGVAVVVHGGFWKAEYGIEYAQPLVPSLLERGWATWVPEYRRVGNGGGVEETLQDVAASLASLTAVMESDLGLVPGEVPVVGIGHSAGGHLVTWAGAGGVLTHVVSQAGVLDLEAADRANLGSGAVRDFLGHPVGEDDAAVDPIRMVPLRVPVWCVHGTADDIVPIEQSRAYVEAATAAGGRAELLEVDGDHFVVIDPASEAWARTLDLLDPLAG